MQSWASVRYVDGFLNLPLNELIAESNVPKGAALAASYILQAQLDKPLEALPFRLAIFICGSLPFSAVPFHGVDITALWNCGGDMLTDEVDYWRSFQQMTAQGIEAPSWDSERNPWGGPTATSHKSGSSLATCRRYHPDADAARIAIPTVHIYGRKDRYREQSVRLRDFCCKLDGLRHEFEHSGGHYIPRDDLTSSKIAESIEKAIRRSELMF